MRNGKFVRFTVVGIFVAALSSTAAQAPLKPTRSIDSPVVRIGAVAYSPNVVTVFTDLRRYLNSNDFACDYVLYSNYDSMVDALGRHEIDIAWNTPLAHAQYHVKSGSSQTLVMRDVDFGVRSVVIARSDSGIKSLKDLSSGRLVLGSLDAAEATVLPIYYLAKEGVDVKQMKLISLDKEIDFKGNPCCSPSHVIQAVREGRGDAGIITESLWRQIESSATDAGKYCKIWTSPSFSHCVFTAPSEFDRTKAQQFIRLMTAMDSQSPGCSEVMRLEGTRKWLPGTSEGFRDLIEAVRNNRE